MALGNGTAETLKSAKKSVLNGGSQRATRKAGLPQKAIGEDGNIDWNFVNPEIERTGQKIVLPADPVDMPIDEAIVALQRRKADEEQIMAVQEEVDAYPLDGAVAFMMALKARYGWATPIPEMTFWGPQPPRMITVATGPNPEEKIQIPWGQFMVPGIEKPIKTISIDTPKGPAFAVIGQLRKKEAHILKELADFAREIVAEHSIYRGRAIRLATNSQGMLDMEIPPTFIGVDHVEPDKLIMSEITGRLIETNVFTLIRKTKRCEEAGIPLKRGVLLHGVYGGGKTLTSLVTAKYAVDNDWTFITLDKPQSLRQALEFAKRYEPCVIFAEDIDRVTATRDEPANDLLNTLDGILSKNSKTMVVLTTNHVDQINKAMLRPGRLDAVIEVTPPDAQAAERLVRLYARDYLPADENLAKLGNVLSGWMPAVIRESVERAKLAMIARNSDVLSEGDLITAALTMEGHRRLLETPPEKDLSPAEAIGKAFSDMISQSLKMELDATTERINDNVDSEGSSTRDTVIDVKHDLEEVLSGIGGRVRNVEAQTEKTHNLLDEVDDRVRDIASHHGID